VLDSSAKEELDRKEESEVVDGPQMTLCRVQSNQACQEVGNIVQDQIIKSIVITSHC
jgi:hypothetical protein